VALDSLIKAGAIPEVITVMPDANNALEACAGATSRRAPVPRFAEQGLSCAVAR